MAQHLESFKDEIKEPKRHDVIREGIICFLVESTIIPVRLYCPPPCPSQRKDAYYPIVYS
ncbi:hypothetical protein HY839_00700 [Candidatus Azambacteria bacterium]|nr:hypothetical protein [Candidatus Azambacteria bacterium]